MAKVKKIFIASENNVQKKAIIYALDQLKNISITHIEDKIKGLSKIFLNKPDIIVVSYNNFQDSIEFITLVRNNKDFDKTHIILVLTERVNIFQRIKISKLNIKYVFYMPINKQDFANTISNL